MLTETLFPKPSMPDRRSFLQQTSLLMGSFLLHKQLSAALPPSLNAQLSRPQTENLTEDEDFWQQVRMAYSASPALINLNNGGVSPAPRATQEALDHYNRMCNEAPSYYMWRILDQNREPLRENLARLAGCDAAEIAINRNATEALNSVIFGLNLKAGDEVVLSPYDYPNMVNAWKQREKRDGIKLVWVDIKLPNENASEMAEAYISKFTAKTKVVHLTHLVNWCGQILPVRKIADEARKRNIDSIVDGAHSFALLDFHIPDLGGDYFGTSLHKWLCGPFGSGMLYIRKDKIKEVWPLLSNDKPDGDDIRKFETLGTRSFPIEMAIGYSLDFHNLIGTARKQKRLFYLKNYWMEQVQRLPNVRFHTSLKPEWGCAIGVFNLENLDYLEVVKKLHEDFKIHAVGIEKESVKGVRITPNVYTTTQELDKLVKAIGVLSKK